MYLTDEPVHFYLEALATCSKFDKPFSRLDLQEAFPSLPPKKVYNAITIMIERKLVQRVGWSKAPGRKPLATYEVVEQDEMAFLESAERHWAELMGDKRFEGRVTHDGRRYVSPFVALERGEAMT